MEPTSHATATSMITEHSQKEDGLEQVLAHSYARKIFALYCNKCYVEELFYFLTEIEELETKLKNPSEHLSKEDYLSNINEFYNTFLGQNSKYEINVSAYIKKQIKENIDKEMKSIREIFRPAISHVMLILKSDVLPRFVRSREWLRFLHTSSGRQFGIFQEKWVPKEVFYSFEDLERDYICEKDFEMVNYLQEDAPHWELCFDDPKNHHSVFFSDKMVTDPKLAGKRKILLIKHTRYVECSAEALIKALNLSKYYKQAVPGTKSLEFYGTSMNTIEPATESSNTAQQKVPTYYSKSVHQFAPILPPNEFRYVSTLRYFPRERKYIAFRKTTSAQGEGVFSEKPKYSLGVSYTAEVVHQITEETCRCCTIVFGFANFKSFFNLIASKMSKAISRRNHKVLSKLLEEAQKGVFDACKEDQHLQLSLKTLQQNALLHGEWDQLPEVFRI